ncbi:alpha/beta fold hydrolase [Mycobacterium shimoidei]|uniref:Alpha/beta hydrolase-like protein [Gordonia sp. KTR9] n=1 Tax=Mycobacterium shimoidei TaxID=29313 RepID=A0A1E3TF81_MYCSH|nr:alpha/beta hydrolase [Mycobacterium shimoidei]MCV7259154.1 alpha/beta hydrolase [Mycobacterium shimoidei]ODR13045.1 alpha/beta hydrolase [Mycobacterium shimoidei]ORW83354.1 alpha/beta hydrolase [Mycobacterium shimoidei]SRX95079.1 alpha/beta hydrolase-like protein [Gordonia sp. KTR9] [Mycobacterium shimoidei]
MPQLSLKQATIEYQEFGPQDSPHPPVVFVHGILVDGRLWRDVVDDLARRGFRCIVPTLPLGSHTIPVGDTAVLSLPGVATLVNETIAALDLSDVTLVGSDTGGGICQLVIDAYPERIGRLVLTNCDAFDKCPPFPFDIVFALLRGPVSIKALFGQLRLRALRHSPLGFGLLINRPDPDLTAAWLQPCLADSRICRDLAALLRRVATTDLTDVATRLPQFNKPVTLVWGQRDRCFTPSLGRRLADLFSNSKLIEVADAKTFVSLDDPDAVIDAIVAITG